MAKKVKEALLNTPESWWIIIRGYHLHKSFWGVILLILGLITWKYYSSAIGLLFLVVGIILIILSILGHIYTQNKPYFKLWEKHKK
ncbi:hypothetical protein KY348_06995 [Candidatus Woesearchaeota archaeon]|nr:hypothetical protein [Candidatus Woesearchaeota archaeon]